MQIMKLEPSIPNSGQARAPAASRAAGETTPTNFRDGLSSDTTAAEAASERRIIAVIAKN
jgi:hypothetical protein